MKKYNFFLLFLIFFNSCLVDVTDDIKIEGIKGIKDIETIISKIDLSSYPTIESKDEFPILAWIGVHQDSTNKKRFQEVKDIGININLTFYSNIEKMQYALDMANEVGIKVLINCPELINDTENTVRRFMNHPANAGYFIKDEPSIHIVSTLAKQVQTIESIDPNHFCYVNLLPNTANSTQMGVSDYKEYVEKNIDGIGLKVLSFDHYPIYGTYITPDWYNNLEIIREVSFVKDIPFWAFVLTTAHYPYPIPDINQIRLQVYSNLAYGAKGIQYFTYWTPVSNVWDFHNGPIERDGSQTKVYEQVRIMNRELQEISSVFLSSEISNITHYGEDIPLGVKLFSKLPENLRSLEIRGGRALISELKNDTNNFIMIQNTNLWKEIGIKVEADSQTSVVLKSGKIVPMSLISEEFKLTPGDMVLLMR